MLKGGAYIVCLKHYVIDLRKLSPQERERIYSKLDQLAFNLIIHRESIGLYDVFWNSPTPIEKSISFPIGSIISQI
jgi:hypothetical protein